MACGTPVIVSNSGGMPELVDNKTGIIFDNNSNFEENLYQAMIHCFDIKFSKKGLISNASKYNIENYCNNFLLLMEDESNEK